jgi:hypothetical protein
MAKKKSTKELHPVAFDTRLKELPLAYIWWREDRYERLSHLGQFRTKARAGVQ